MRKIYLLVSSFVLICSSYGQLTNAKKETLTIQKQELALTGQVESTPNTTGVSGDRAAGDVIWGTDFSFSANWDVTVTGGTADADHNWIVGTASTWFYPGMTSTSGGNYATCKNGDPSGGTQYSGGDFIFAFDSVFNLTGIPNVLLEFEQYGARFNDDQRVQVSTNGGTVWTTVYSNSVKPGLFLGAGTSYPNGELVQFDITDAIAGNPANVRIRFILNWDVAIASPGITYGWLIDDVALREAYDYDVELVNPFMSIGAWPADISRIPTTQISDLTFTATVQNDGNLGLTNVVLSADIPTASFSGTSTGSPLAAGSSDSLVVTTVFTPPTTTGTHNVNFSLAATETLDNSANDDETSTIQITNNIMAVDRYANTEASITDSFFGWGSPTSGIQSIGNVFEVYNDSYITGVQVGVREYNTSGNSEGLILNVVIHIFDGTDFIEDYTYEDYIVEPTDIGKLTTITFDEPYQVTAGTIYYIGAGGYDGSEVAIMMAGESPIGTIFGTSGVDFIELNDADPTVKNVGTPVVRAIFDPNASTIENEMTNFSVGQNVPNPFDGTSVITYTLTESSNVSVEFVDVTGKVVKTVAPGTLNAGTYTLTVDGSELAEGVYFYTFTIGDRKVTKQMVVTK